MISCKHTTLGRPSCPPPSHTRQVPQDPVWAGNFAYGPGDVFLGVGSSAAELLQFRPASGDEEAGEARGGPPLIAILSSEADVGLEENITPGQFAR